MKHQNRVIQTKEVLKLNHENLEISDIPPRHTTKLIFSNMCQHFCILLFLVINFSVDVESQDIPKRFKLDGIINSNIGVAILLPIGDEAFYPKKRGVYETKVINTKFTFSDSCLYPYAFKIGLKVNSEWIYISDIFFVDPGNQNIICNTDSSRRIPKIFNITMVELKDKYNNLPNTVKFYNSNSDSILLMYTKANPNSYVSLWKLIEKFSGYGYKSIYDSIYAHLTPQVKNTYSGKILWAKLIEAKTVNIGSIFPSLKLLDSEKKKILLDSKYRSKFTLIDFWHSHCGPCIGQFGTLKKLYSTYSSKGFSIIGISNENFKTINDWESIIKTHQLPWNQFLDINGKVCSDLNIYVFPSNFLLNERGEIIAKNIKINALSSLLEDNLKYP